MATGNKSLLGLVFLMASCNDDAKTTTSVQTDTAQQSQSVIMDTVSSGCYTQVVGRDTSNLQIEGKGNSVTGSLSYDFHEKDRNEGSLQGEQSGDTIIAWYLFKSEGMVSVRQVAWKINGEELWPAVGEMTQRNDTALFAQPDRLRYDSTRPFKKIACVI